MCSIQTIVTPFARMALIVATSSLTLALRQAAGDLVEQKYSRTAGERPGHLKALALEQE